jgi:hypothetical protein
MSRKFKTLKPSVYRKAAELIETELFACIALAKVFGFPEGRVILIDEEFESFFKPEHLVSDSAWLNTEDEVSSTNPEQKLFRELVLLFMAEIAADERKRSKPLKPEVYRAAAELIVSKGAKYACHAISDVIGDHELNFQDIAFEELFKPTEEESSLSSAWLSEIDEFYGGTELGDLRRSIALLFMAEIAGGK